MKGGHHAGVNVKVIKFNPNIKPCNQLIPAVNIDAGFGNISMLWGSGWKEWEGRGRYWGKVSTIKALMNGVSSNSCMFG